MPLYTMKCSDCDMKMEVLVNYRYKGELCPSGDCSGRLERIGIEMQKRPHVQGGTSNARYKN
jgi:predicted nucleic acid-binding Zn ribbon protein